MTGTQEAQKRLEALRASLSTYKAARNKTQAMIASGKTMHPQKALQLAESLRDKQVEQKAAQSLVDLNRVMLGRDPTNAELEFGIPPQLGADSLLPVALIVAGGAWGTSALLDYLTEREQRIQAEIDPQGSKVSSFLSGRGPWIGALIAGGAAVGGYFLLQRFRSSGEEDTEEIEEDEESEE